MNEWFAYQVGVPINDDGDFTDAYTFHGNPEKVFREFFGGDNPFAEFFDRFDRILDWLADWLIDWLTDWLANWLIDWLINWTIEPLNQLNN